MTSDALALLARVGIDAFERPQWLGLGALAALAVCLIAARRRAPALGWGAADLLSAARVPRRDGLRAAALALRGLALAALAAVLAGPVGVHQAPPEPGFGLDLVLVLDASGSMRALDTEVEGEWRTRLELAREAVARFAGRRAAAGDRVGLVVFGESAFTQSPLTGDGALLNAALARVEAGMAGEATALGDALALAVKRATGAGAAAARSSAGRVVVLLSDGRSNAGALSVEAATALATAAALRVHTVAIGSAGDEVPMAGEGGAVRRFERHEVDPDTLQRVAAETGGRFFAARRSADLEAVYATIDALERVERPLAPRRRHAERPEPLLGIVFALVAVEIALARGPRRRLP